MKRIYKIIILGLILTVFLIPTDQIFAAEPSGGTGPPLLGSIISIINLALGAIMNLYVAAAGFAVLQVSKFLIAIASYNNFVDQPAIVNAWALVRDIANMVLVLVLLFIAFATIFNASKYSYKQLLPRLLVMAIVINFSRTIAGLMIDFGQVFMLTFVNAWAGAAGGNFINALKLREILEINPELQAGDAFTITVGYLMAGAIITVTLIVLLAFALILTLRIVTLWMLIVLSPIVFALSAWPSEKARKHYAQWWDKFVDNIVVGPATAFFLWLTLATIGGGDIAQSGGEGGLNIRDSGEINLPGGRTAAASSLAATTVVRLEHFASYIIGIGMMIASIGMIQEMKVAGAKVGTSMLNFAQSKAKDLAYKYTGAKAVKERYQAFQSMRESARKEKVQAFAARAYGVYGNIQATVGNVLRRANIGDQWQQHAAKQKEQAAQARKSADAARQAGNVTLAGSLDAQAAKLETSASQWELRAKWAKAGQVIAGIAAAPLTGGLSGAAIAPLLGPGLAKSGKQAQAQAKSYRFRQVTQQLDALKTAKKGDIMSKSNGIGVADNYEQMAAIIRMIQEGWYDSTTDVIAAFGTLQKLGADEKTISTFEASASRNYPTTQYRDLSGAVDVNKLDKAILDGTLDIKQINVADFKAENGIVPVEVMLKGTKDQWESMLKPKGRKDAVREGLEAYRKDKLDIATGSGLNAGRDAYSDDMQKVSSGIMMAGGGIGAFGFDPATGNYATTMSVAEASTHKNSFEQAVRGRNANKMLLSVKANQVIDGATGNTTQAGTQILRNLSKAAFSNTAKEAFENGDPDQIATIKELLKYIEGAGPSLAAPTDDFQRNVRNLYEYVQELGTRNRFDVFR